MKFGNLILGVLAMSAVGAFAENISLATAIAESSAETTVAESTPGDSTATPPVDDALVEQYRNQIMSDPTLMNKAQGAIDNPYAPSTDTLIDKGYEKTFGRQPTAMEKEVIKQQLSTSPPSLSPTTTYSTPSLTPPTPSTP